MNQLSFYYYILLITYLSIIYLFYFLLLFLYLYVSVICFVCNLLCLFLYIFVTHSRHMYDIISYVLLADKCPYRSYSGPYFPAFGLNTERYRVSLRIQPKCGKMLTRITPNTDTFHAVLYS